MSSLHIVVNVAGLERELSTHISLNGWFTELGMVGGVFEVSGVSFS